ncbi:MAG: hypothetical protein ABIS86_17710 [Streptosporangiaceae bacterium]
MRFSMIIAATALLLLTGCTDGESGGGGTPDGYVRGAGAKVSLAYPKSWTAAPATTTTPVDARDGANAQIQVLEEVSKAGSADLLGDIAQTSPQLQAPGYERKGSKKISVPGAQAATRIDYVYKTDQGVPAAGVGLGILDKDDHVHVVRLSWLTGKLDDSAVEDIIDSVKVT